MALAQNRFTLWDLNPNDVATFIVVLILSLPVATRLTKHFLCFVWLGGAALLALLVGTGSRGGVLALACGSLAGIVSSWHLGYSTRNWRTWVVAGLILIVGVAGGLAIFPKSFRLGSLDISPEASAGRRLEVWSTVPAMLAAAPEGWGIGQSAEAYEQWFEPIGEPVELKHLLSSHLTWLVEFGWPTRWLYIFLWMAAFTLLLPSSKFNFPVWGFAVWIGFGVALFYNAAGKWWNWPLPSLWLLAAFALRCRQKTFPTGLYWLAPFALSSALVGLPFLLLKLYPSLTPLQTRDGGNIVMVGKGEPAVAILGPDKSVLGNFYGQEIRKEFAGIKGSILVVGEPDASAAAYLADCPLYVISGADENILARWQLIVKPKAQDKLVLINCRAPIDDWIKAFGQVLYSRGEFYGDPHSAEWANYSAGNSTVSVEEIPMTETYVANWWPLLKEGSVK